MRSLKIAFSVLLCVTILSVGASVVCAVIAGNTAESFRDYRSSVITALSSLHAQLNSSKQAFAEALTYLEGEQNTEQQTEPATESMTESATDEQQSTAQTEQDSASISAAHKISAAMRFFTGFFSFPQILSALYHTPKSSASRDDF